MKKFALLFSIIFCVLTVGLFNNVAGQTPAQTGVAATTTAQATTTTDPNASAPADEPKAWEDMDADEKADKIVTDFKSKLGNIKRNFVEVKGPTMKKVWAGIDGANTKAEEACKIATKAGEFSIDDLAMDIYIAKGYNSEQWKTALDEAQTLLMDPNGNRAKLVEYKKQAYAASFGDLFANVPREMKECEEEVIIPSTGQKTKITFKRQETAQEAMARILTGLSSGKPADADVYTKAEVDGKIADEAKARENADEDIKKKIPTCQQLSDDLAKFMAEKGYLTEARGNELYGCKNQTEQAISDSKKAMELAQSVDQGNIAIQEDMQALGKAVGKVVAAGGKGRDQKQIEEAKSLLLVLYEKWEAQEAEKEKQKKEETKK